MGPYSDLQFPIHRILFCRNPGRMWHVFDSGLLLPVLVAFSWRGNCVSSTVICIKLHSMPYDP